MTRVAYKGTWSDSQLFRKVTGRDAHTESRGELTAAWGNPEQEREIACALQLRIGMITAMKP